VNAITATADTPAITGTEVWGVSSASAPNSGATEVAIGSAVAVAVVDGPAVAVALCSDCVVREVSFAEMEASAYCDDHCDGHK